MLDKIKFLKSEIEDGVKTSLAVLQTDVEDEGEHVVSSANSMDLSAVTETDEVTEIAAASNSTYRDHTDPVAMGKSENNTKEINGDHTVLSLTDAAADCILPASIDIHRNHNLKETFVDHLPGASKETDEDYILKEAEGNLKEPLLMERNCYGAIDKEMDKDCVVPTVKEKDGAPSAKETYKELTVVAGKGKDLDAVNEDCIVPIFMQRNCKESFKDKVCYGIL